MKTAIVCTYYRELPGRIVKVCRETHVGADQVVYVHQQPGAKPGLQSMFRNVLTGLGQLAPDTDIVFIAEHDVLYPPGYFTDIDGDGRGRLVYYGPGMFVSKNGFWPRRPPFPLSTLHGYVNVVTKAIQKKFDVVAAGERLLCAEPCLVDGFAVQHRIGDLPYIDIRWGGNYTEDRESVQGYQIEACHCGLASELWERLGM